jgi:hypothetical protein
MSWQWYELTGYHLFQRCFTHTKLTSKVHQLMNSSCLFHYPYYNNRQYIKDSTRKKTKQINIYIPTNKNCKQNNKRKHHLIWWFKDDKLRNSFIVNSYHCKLIPMSTRTTINSYQHRNYIERIPLCQVRQTY